MKEEKAAETKFIKALKLMAPGTILREGLENILRAKSGALIVIGDSSQVMGIVEGGFEINRDLSPTTIYELAKMDGAIVVSHDGKRILYANTQLIPDPATPSQETGIRHRTAERVARQTGETVISISQRRGIITIYQGSRKYILRELGVMLSKANQALQTLEKYKVVFDKALLDLGSLEFEDMVTVLDVIKTLQRATMVMGVVRDIERYLVELGKEGRLVNMQVEELMVHVEQEALLILQDYLASASERSAKQIHSSLMELSREELLEPINLCRTLGYGSNPAALDQVIIPHGYRLLEKIPRLPQPVIDNLINTFDNLQSILRATLSELDDVEGIGEVRARSIKDGFKRLREQVFLERHLLIP